MSRLMILPLAVLATSGCAQAEPVGSSPPESESLPPTQSTPAPSEAGSDGPTELGAVALPDAKGCVERCTAQRPEAECRSECAEKCLAHCKTGPRSNADWAATCARDCQSQLDAASTLRSR
jgi:hypothetical protein